DHFPSVRFDHASVAMTERAPAQSVPQRTTVSRPEDSKPSNFPQRTCEAPVPPGVTSAEVAGQPLPLPHARLDRIVVIGDTGCRLKKDGGYQACNHPEAYPFAHIASLAANWKPDLIVHVGDYHYRENACPADRPGCTGSPWGYGWDAWKADFFGPGKVLLQAAPWVMARGNHESCARAGQGFRRFLDPAALRPELSCNDAANDQLGDYSEPYAVPLGDGAQLIVIDTSNTTYKGLAPNDIRMAKFADMYRKMEKLAQNASVNLVVNHHPILAMGAVRNPDGSVKLFAGDAGLQNAFSAVNPLLLPPTINAMLSGHVHLWQQVSFSCNHPSQLVSGFSGTAEDTVPLPAVLPPGATPAPGAVVDQFSSWVDGFGYMTMQRSGPADWDIKVWDLQGRVRNTCALHGSKSSCEQPLIY
ncbi:MAG: metallophosphoesterase, partial [Massilia sp.]